MTVTVEIKIETHRLRIYFTGDTTEINQYLAPKYKEVRQALNQEKTQIEQAKAELLTLREEGENFKREMLYLNPLDPLDPESGDAFEVLREKLRENSAAQDRLSEIASRTVHGYRAEPYHFIWTIDDIKQTRIELMMPVTELFNDEAIMNILSDLIAPLDLGISTDQADPNMHVCDLKPRCYVTVFPSTETVPDLALQVINNLERMALKFVKEKVDPAADTVPSDITFMFEPLKPACHVKKLGVFGHVQRGGGGGGAAAEIPAASSSL